MNSREFEAAIGAAIDAAGAALTIASAAGAERLGKAASALIRARRDLADAITAAAANESEEDEEALRAELRRRVARFVEADLAGAPPEVLDRIATAGLVE